MRRCTCTSTADYKTSIRTVKIAREVCRYPTECSVGYPTECSVGYPTECSVGYPTECSVGYPPETHLKLKPREILLIRSIGLKFCTELVSYTAVLCAKRLVYCVSYGQKRFARFAFKMHIVSIQLAAGIRSTKNKLYVWRQCYRIEPLFSRRQDNTWSDTVLCHFHCCHFAWRENEHR